MCDGVTVGRYRPGGRANFASEHHVRGDWPDTRWVPVFTRPSANLYRCAPRLFPPRRANPGGQQTFAFRPPSPADREHLPRVTPRRTPPHARPPVRRPRAVAPPQTRRSRVQPPARGGHTTGSEARVGLVRAQTPGRFARDGRPATARGSPHRATETTKRSHQRARAL